MAVSESQPPKFWRTCIGDLPIKWVKVIDIFGISSLAYDRHGGQRPIDVYEAWVKMKDDKHQRNYRVNVGCIDWGIRVDRVTPSSTADEPEYFNVTVHCREKRPKWAVDARVTIHLRNHANPDDHSLCYRDYKVARFHSTQPTFEYKKIMTLDDVYQPSTDGLRIMEDGNFMLVVTLIVTRVHVSHYPNLIFEKDMLPGADVYAQCGNKKLYMHKQYISIHSEFFGPALSERFKEKQSVVADTAPRFFGNLLRSIYPNRQPITSANLVEMSRLGDYYGMPAVMTACENFLLNSKCNFTLGQKFHIAFMHRFFNAEAKLLQQTKNSKDIEEVLEFAACGDGKLMNPNVLVVLKRRLVQRNKETGRNLAMAARTEIALAKRVDVVKADPKKVDEPYGMSCAVTADDIVKYRDVLAKKFGHAVVSALHIQPNVRVNEHQLKREARKRCLDITQTAKLERRRVKRMKRNEARKRRLSIRKDEKIDDQTQKRKPRGLKEKRKCYSKKKTKTPAANQVQPDDKLQDSVAAERPIDVDGQQQ